MKSWLDRYKWHINWSMLYKECKSRWGSNYKLYFPFSPLVLKKLGY